MYLCNYSVRDFSQVECSPEVNALYFSRLWLAGNDFYSLRLNLTQRKLSPDFRPRYLVEIIRNLCVEMTNIKEI